MAGKGKPRGRNTVMTTELKISLSKDSHEHSINWMAKKYNIHPNTVKKIIKEYPTTPKLTLRESEDPLKRTELLAGDSARVIELTIFSMKKLLESEIESKRLDPTVKSTITIRDLKDFFETVAPYVLKKSDTTPVKKGEKTPMAMVHNMFAKKPVS
jgi:hypothetical protein